ncbi:MAG TPA: DinB family protein [Dehalococcoidia bacterium]|nr:DinB family protein [Dehalococcoidia bacterium]
MHRLVERALFDMQQARAGLLRELARVTDADWSRYVPFGEWTLKDLLAHLAAYDGMWAMTTQSLLASDGVAAPSVSDIDAAREAAVVRGRKRSVASLLEELDRRRRLLIGYLELLEERHLAKAVPGAPAGEDSVRAQIWVGYHDRQHAADIRRALATWWEPERLQFAPEIQDLAHALSPDPALRVLYSVAPDAWASPSPFAGSSYHDLLARLATGDRALQRYLRAALTTGAGTGSDFGHEERDLVEEQREVSEEELIEEFIASRHETLRLLSGLRAEHLRAPAPCAWDEPAGEGTLLECMWRFSQREARHLAALRMAMPWRRG